MKKKIVSIHQPNFIPWLGFFDKMAKSDILVIYDNSTVKKNSIVNRNKIKTPQGATWLTVPIHASLTMPVNQWTIDNSSSWNEDHLKTLFFNYKRAKFFDKIYPEIEKIYSRKHKFLIDLNLELIKFIAKMLNIKTKIEISSGLKAEGEKNEILIDMVKKAKGNIYLSGDGSRDYIDEKLFEKADIELRWQNYKPPQYSQLWGEFIPHLSALDFLFCDLERKIS